MKIFVVFQAVSVTVRYDEHTNCKCKREGEVWVLLLYTVCCILCGVSCVAAVLFLKRPFAISVKTKKGRTRSCFAVLD